MTITDADTNQPFQSRTGRDRIRCRTGRPTFQAPGQHARTGGGRATHTRQRECGLRHQQQRRKPGDLRSQERGCSHHADLGGKDVGRRNRPAEFREQRATFPTPTPPAKSDEEEVDDTVQSSKTQNATYAVDKVVRHILQPVGRIRRISAALLVDDAVDVSAGQRKELGNPAQAHCRKN